MWEQLEKIVLGEWYLCKNHFILITEQKHVDKTVSFSFNMLCTTKLIWLKGESVILNQFFNGIY